MQSWEAMFSPVQIKDLASFVKSLKGTNPAMQKLRKEMNSRNSV
jgi:hypothetical protein